MSAVKDGYLVFLISAGLTEAQDEQGLRIILSHL
jgi:hypothetical protein